MIKRNKAATILETRIFKILAVKKEEINNSLVFLCQKIVNDIEKKELDTIIQEIDKISPDSCYFKMYDDICVEFYNKTEFANKNVILTVNIPDLSKERMEEIKKELHEAIPDAKSIVIVNGSISITE